MNGNVFDPANYPEGVPTSLYSGDFWAFKFSDLSAAYPPATYSLNVILIRQDATGDRHVIPAADVSGVFTVELTGNDPGGGDPYSGEVEPDEYFYKVQAVRTVDDEDVTVDQGYTTVRPSTDAAGDVRPHTLIVLQNVRAVLEKTATNEQASYSVAGRSLARRSLEELRELEEEYAQKWENEKARIDRAAGRKAESRNTLIQLDA